jgi:hypothetical protein
VVSGPQGLSFHTEYAYPTEDAGILVPVRLKAPETSPSTSTKRTDIGESFCIFNRGYAEALGVAVETGQPVRVGMATGKIDAYGHVLSTFLNQFGTRPPACCRPVARSCMLSSIIPAPHARLWPA